MISKYGDTDDGGRIASVSKIYKDNETILLNVNISDLRQLSKYYPGNNEFRPRTNSVTLYTKNPAEERNSLYLYDDKVTGYGDMPLELLLEKFKKNGT